MILGKLTEEQELDYSPEEEESLFEEDDDVIRGPHGYNKNCMCNECNPPGWGYGD
jgi:hypothetical protein